MRHDFLLAFVDALQPVFLVGAALTAVAFVLSLTAQGGAAARDDARRPSDLAAEEAAARGDRRGGDDRAGGAAGRAAAGLTQPRGALAGDGSSPFGRWSKTTERAS